MGCTIGNIYTFDIYTRMYVKCVYRLKLISLQYSAIDFSYTKNCEIAYFSLNIRFRKMQTSSELTE